MNNEDIRKWCHQEMRALADSPIHARGRAILALVNAADAPLWLADAAEALGEVRPSDGAPLALNWTQVIEAIHDLREDRDDWKLRANRDSALAKLTRLREAAQAVCDARIDSHDRRTRLDQEYARDSARNALGAALRETGET